jgi:hypothetical protein
VKPTSLRLLAWLAVVAAMLGWALANWIDNMGRLIAIPWLAPVTLWLFALMVLWWARGTRARLDPESGRPRMDPIVAARTAALALAGSRTGAGVFGLYGGIAIRLLGETAIAAGRERLFIAVLAALGALALAAASLYLERICRIPEDPNGNGAAA